MFAEDSITIYNQYEDASTRTTKWNRTVLHGVHSFVNVKATMVNQSGRPSNECVFRIPYTCDKYTLYMPESDYHYSANKSTFWTLATGDLIVAGVCTLNISGIQTLTQNHIKAFRISAISDNRKGIEPHLRARCE